MPVTRNHRRATLAVAAGAILLTMTGASFADDLHSDWQNYQDWYYHRFYYMHPASGMPTQGRMGQTGQMGPAGSSRPVPHKQ